MLNLFTLVAKLALDKKEYDDGLDDAQEKAGGFGSALKKAAKIGGAAIATASAAVGAMAKQAVDSYADYEQLVGGVETLFGESSQKVIADANNAFKTAGMSVNDYMETSIQSAAALINSLDGDQAKAADLMNMSIVDMSDNVNKMGTSMEAVQNAYRGFSRGNFTMLDNLALGFAGTKEGMQQLLDKAQEISGFEYDISSYSDIVQAIHVVQEEMGIAGTTQKEAAETISGSLSSVKSAWSNLITGIANENADFGTLIDNFVDSLSTAGKNLIPRFGTALEGVGKLVTGLAPVIIDAIPTLVDEVVPSLLDSAVTLVGTLANALVDNVPKLLESATTLLLSLADRFTDADSIAEMIDVALRLMVALAEGLGNAVPQLLEKVPEIIGALIQAIFENLPRIVESGLRIAASILDGVVRGWGNLIGEIPGLMGQILSGIGEFFGALAEAGRQIVEEIKQGFKQKVEEAKQWGKDLIQNFIDGITAKWEALKDKVSGVAGTVKKFLGFSEPEEGPLSDFHTYAPDMMELFAKGIRDNAGMVENELNRALDFDVKTKVPTQSYAGAGGGDIDGWISVIISAMREALAGVGIYLDTRKVGEIVAKSNENLAMAWR